MPRAQVGRIVGRSYDMAGQTFELGFVSHLTTMPDAETIIREGAIPGGGKTGKDHEYRNPRLERIRLDLRSKWNKGDDIKRLHFHGTAFPPTDGRGQDLGAGRISRSGRPP